MIIPTKEIDKALESDSLNLNKLEAQYSAQIINILKPNKVFIDSPSNNIKSYVNYLKIYVKDKRIDIIAAHKAESKYLEVAAASVLAKVTRDEEINRIKKVIKEDFGSGYPSDPLTQKFLKSNHKKHGSIFRKSWSTYKDVERSKGNLTKWIE